MTMSDFDARAVTWDDDPAKVERARLGTQARGAGFATVEFATAHEIEKMVDGRPRRYPVFLMVARKASGGARGGKWPSSND